MPTQFTPLEAETQYKITAKHSQMDNGELRFRLESGKDGTAYIRTESIENGGWQNAHFHERVLETYIVQKKWVVLCELVNGVYEYTKFEEREIFTTKQRIVHNVYMPAEAVIHTVKHGSPSQGVIVDRIGDTQEAEQMTRDNLTLDEAGVLRLARPFKHGESLPGHVTNGANGKTDFERHYSAEYRHFDGLIWQIPAWSFTVLTLSFFAAANVKDDSPIATYLHLTNCDYIFVATFSAFGLFLALLSYALYRFRWHQASVAIVAPVKKYLKTQVLLQFFVSTESLVLLLLALKGIPSPTTTESQKIFVAFILIVILFWTCYAMETSIHKRASSVVKSLSPS